MGALVQLDWDMGTCVRPARSAILRLSIDVDLPRFQARKMAPTTFQSGYRPPSTKNVENCPGPAPELDTAKPEARSAK